MFKLWLKPWFIENEYGLLKFDILKLLDIDYDIERYLNKFLKETECM